MTGSAGATVPPPGGVAGSVGAGATGPVSGPSGSSGFGRLPSAEAMFSRSSDDGSEKSRPALTVHSKVTVAVAPPATSPAGTARVVRPPAPGAESANEPTSAAPTESARESSLAAMPLRGLSRRMVFS